MPQPSGCMESTTKSWKTLDEFFPEEPITQHDLEQERKTSFSLEDLYPKWQERAHCAGVGLDNYFGPDSDNDPNKATKISQVRRAAKLCDVCPVFRECLTHALEYREGYGVWAGTSRARRKKMFELLDQGATVDQIVEAFTHERRGEPPRDLRRADDARRAGVQDETARTIAL